MENVFRLIESEKDKYTDFLCDICSFEAKAQDKETIDKMNDLMTEFFIKEGFSVTRTKMERCGDFLSVDMNAGAEKGCIFLAHTDTVHDSGVFGKNPVTRTEDKIIAPGAIDCKGGIPISLLAMKALRENGYKKHLRLILTSDEEISNVLGGKEEQEFFKTQCEGFPYAFNCETTEKDEVVVSRKGILRYRINIKGVGGHSGIHYFECKNAILEAAHKIIALHSKSQVGGITYSCNIIQGGVLANIIPDSCIVTVDIRVPRHADITIAEETVKEIVSTSFIEGTQSELVTVSKRPPMEKRSETVELFQKLLKASKKYGLGGLTPVESGGGSDSCYTQAAGVTSICGMGGSGEFCHTNKEYIFIPSIALRAKIISVFLMEE